MTAESIILISVFGLAAGAIAYYQVRSRVERKKASRARGGVPELDEEDAYVIAGINKYGLAPGDCGTYKGWVFRDAENKFDENAVAVFKGTTHIGYLYRKVAESVAEDVEACGGQVPAVVKIERRYDDEEKRYYFFGWVQILWPDTE